MKNYMIAGLFVPILLACGSAVTTNEKSEISAAQPSDTISAPIIEKVIIPLDSLVKGLDTSYTHKTLLIPDGFTAKVLFAQKDPVRKADGSVHPAKGNHDMLAFIPDADNPNRGWLYVSHETKGADENLGDGGGATMFIIEKNAEGQWEVIGDYHHVDFSTVRGTDRNCGGTLGPNGKIYTCEESAPKSNAAAYDGGKGHRDTSNVGNLKLHENIGWVVEVDPITRKATQKMVAMGRYFHEDLEFMEDNRTVYLSDDYEPAVFFKFVADQPLDYSQGQLYAYKQSEDGESGTWLALPRDTATMVRARDAAIEMGASMYVRHEWFARVGNKIYIGETGHDESDWSNRLKQGGVPGWHVKNNLMADGKTMRDVWGRILVFDITTNKMSVHLEGGKSKDGKTLFSNPDCVEAIEIGGKMYLLIHEDLNWYDKGRNPMHIEKKKQFVNELFLLDLSLENPTVDDLVRFAIAPIGAEFTGGIMSPDGSTLFLNIQHPASTNNAPYNRSVTVAITGFKRP
jgi:secreted PhoX family phosphatase